MENDEDFDNSEGMVRNCRKNIRIERKKKRKKTYKKSGAR